MAKSRPSGRSKGPRRDAAKSILNSTQGPRAKRKAQSALSPTALLTQATDFLQTGQPDAALPLAQRALALLQQLSSTPMSMSAGPPTQKKSTARASLPALNLLGEIYIELGDSENAASHFLEAIEADPEGAVPQSEGGGAERFLWMAQLCEEGGEDSIAWFERGCQILERDIVELEARSPGRVEVKDLLEEKKRRLAAALCGMVEVWMTDLSLHPNAETTSTSLVARAINVSPTPSTLQTQASLLLSQSNILHARSILVQSLSLWQDLPEDHPDVPDFPSRISLSRLLMEARLEEQAMGVLEGLVAIEDGSVEGWYLGGWCALLMAGMGRNTKADREDTRREDGENEETADKEVESEEIRTEEERRVLMLTSREWLRNSLQLFELQEYEDDRLRDHALELVEELNRELQGVEDDAEGGDWEDEDEDGDGENDHEGQDLEMNGT